MSYTTRKLCITCATLQAVADVHRSAKRLALIVQPGHTGANCVKIYSRPDPRQSACRYQLDYD